ncbi:MAG TPA: hypothetical protein VKR06_25110, partial [Ktedonosporobacter sp.]|nr:hypothetical protein [Ktedonosporobacter sp.]
PFPWPGFISAKTDAGIYLYMDGKHLLLLSGSHLSPRQIDAVRQNRIELALLVRKNLFFFCYHIAGFAPWGDIPYNWHLIDDEQARTFPPDVAPSEYLPLLIVLVESTTQRIVGRRGIRLPPMFGKTLHDALRVQAHAAFNNRDFEQRIDRMQEEFWRPEDLAAVAQVACVIESWAEQKSREN